MRIKIKEKAYRKQPPIRDRRSFTLLETMVAVTILAIGIVFVFRAFTISLSVVRMNQNMTSANLLFKEKLWEVEQLCKNNPHPQMMFQEEVTIRNRIFRAGYQLYDTVNPQLKRLVYTISWRERGAPYSIEYKTYVRAAQ